MKNKLEKNDVVKLKDGNYYKIVNCLNFYFLSGNIISDEQKKRYISLESLYEDIKDKIIEISKKPKPIFVNIKTQARFDTIMYFTENTTNEEITEFITKNANEIEHTMVEPIDNTNTIDFIDFNS